MKISVITVCYNSATTILDTIKSVQAQNWELKEHILIDGNSNDGTLTIIRENSAYIKHILSEPDDGIYDAMNKGIKLATGEVIAFLNADDIYENPNTLRDIALFFSENMLDVLMGDVIFVDRYSPNKKLRYYSSKGFSYKSMAWGWMPAHPGLFITRKIYDIVGPYRTDLKIAGDFDFIARVFSRQNLKFKHYPGVVVRMRAGGISTSGFKSKILLNCEVRRVCLENGIKTNWAMLLSKYFFKIFEFFIR